MDFINEIFRRIRAGIEWGFNYIIESGWGMEIIIGLVFLTFFVTLVARIRERI